MLHNPKTPGSLLCKFRSGRRYNQLACHLGLHPQCAESYKSESRHGCRASERVPLDFWKNKEGEIIGISEAISTHFRVVCLV